MLISSLTFSLDFCKPSCFPLSSLGFPYHLSTSGWMNLCQINNTTGTSIHDIHTILKRETLTFSSLTIFNTFLLQDFSLFCFTSLRAHAWTMLDCRWSSQHRLSNGVCFGKFLHFLSARPAFISCYKSLLPIFFTYVDVIGSFKISCGPRSG